MSEAIPVADQGLEAPRSVFISHATADLTDAMAICGALERRGVRCWISGRDVAPGDNYQEAIVRAIREARALVLVFTGAANRSDEIKKELSLASRHHVPVLALRLDDVEPSDAFAYELSTRQWIDADPDLGGAVGQLAARIGQLESGAPLSAPEPSPPPRRRRGRLTGRRSRMIAALLIIVVALSVAAWWLWRPGQARPSALRLGLTQFELLSPDLPATMPEAVRDELLSALSDDGVVSASTASGADPPAFALAGTIRRQGDAIRIIARLNDPGSGATVWTGDFEYGAADAERAPRLFALEAGDVMRCGLFGLSTYPGKLPAETRTDYLQYCRNLVKGEHSKALDFARKVVAKAPGFSWGWSAVEIAATNMLVGPHSPDEDARLRFEAVKAADKAVALDPTNSEALTFKSHLIDPADLVGREQLIKRAIAARPLPCGCEHHLYADLLREVGRLDDAIAEYRRAIDIMPFNNDSQASLGETLLIAGRPEQAAAHFKAAAELIPDPGYAARLPMANAPASRDYAAALPVLRASKGNVPEPARLASIAAYTAMVSGDPLAKARAAAAVRALPLPLQGRYTVPLLSDLGAITDMADVTEQLIRARRPGVRSLLFYPGMANARAQPDFAELAASLGLIDYWRKTGTKPDLCRVEPAPSWCRGL